MSYLALARKYRPKQFSELVGQSHVLTTLTHAIEQNRLHHAYLFSGTRGVGKTTLARILAKCVNCEQGITATPCLICDHCLEIDAGRFPDLIEVDAASRTKVEDTRDLLEQVPYAPTKGRYKIYLIDEVHMLSGHSFNALLKTLEEPPKHVIFLFATTESERIPVTILSRCLQFHLKALPLDLMVQKIAEILQAEQIPFQKEALLLVAEAAKGSMRDALSILDQAIAFTNQHITSEEVQKLLGFVSPLQLFPLLEVLLEQNSSSVLAEVEKMKPYAPDYTAILEQLLVLFHHIALAQQAEHALSSYVDNPDYFKNLCTKASPETIQLYYQIGLMGLKDLALAPSPAIGFEMTLLRMLAFTPASLEQATPILSSQSKSINTASPSRTAGSSHPSFSENLSSPIKPVPTNLLQTPPAIEKQASDRFCEQKILEKKTQAPPDVLGEPWIHIIQKMNLTGPTMNLAKHCVPCDFNPPHLTSSIEKKHEALITPNNQKRLQDALSSFLCKPIVLTFVTVHEHIDTPQKHEEKKQLEQFNNAKKHLENHEEIKALCDAFSGNIIEGTMTYPVNKKDVY